MTSGKSRLRALAGEIGSGVKNQPVSARREHGRAHVASPSVGVGDGLAERRLADRRLAVAWHALEPDGQAGRGQAARGVQDMRRNRAGGNGSGNTGASHAGAGGPRRRYRSSTRTAEQLPEPDAVICCSSDRTTPHSVSGSFSSRTVSRASRSPAVRPVAQTR